MKERLLAVGIVVFVIAIDAAAKTWAERTLLQGDAVPVLDEVVRWRLGFNTGIAFGFFANGSRVWLVLIALIILGLILWFARLLTAGGPLFTMLSLGLILGGALANFLDRLSDGQVTDFLDVGICGARWPAFNLADTAVTLGVAALVIATLCEDRRPEWRPGSG